MPSGHSTRTCTQDDEIVKYFGLMFRLPMIASAYEDGIIYDSVAVVCFFVAQISQTCILCTGRCGSHQTRSNGLQRNCTAVWYKGASLTLSTHNQPSYHPVEYPSSGPFEPRLLETTEQSVSLGLSRGHLCCRPRNSLSPTSGDGG